MPSHLDSKKVLLFGAGGVGAVYLSILAKGGAEVTAVCRSNFTAAKENGFTIESAIWGTSTVKPAVFASVADAAAAGPYDFIVICSKAYVGVTPSTAELIKPAVEPDTAIVLCQNGVGIETEYAEMYPSNVLISGVVYLPVTQTSPGHIVHGDLEQLEIGTYPASSNSPVVARFAAIYTAGGGSISVHDDVQERRWTKLITNAAWNPICALSQCADADFLRTSPESVGIVRRAMLEVVHIAQAKGYDKITEKTADWQLSRALGRLKTKGKEPSMLTDVREGRHRGMEVEPIVGNAMRIAREVGVETPTLDTIYVLVKGLSRSRG